VLARLNNSFCEAQQRDAANKPDNGFPAFVSLALAVVNARSGTATFALAGAEPPLLIRGSGGSSTQPEVVRAEGLPLGVLPGMDYENRVTHLAPGDLILMATDGLTEARHGGKFLGHDGMSDLAQQAMLICAGAATRNEPATLPRIGQHLVEAARAFADGKFHDDVCLLLARRPC
jgi:serine phosphatase RsbU (regulator of sigma subunit)